MAMNRNLPASDSAATLHELIGEDSTATFENDPKFIDSTPAADASSENLQMRRDREDIRNSPSIKLRDSEDVEDDDEEEDDDDFEDVETEDEDEDDEEEDDDFEDDEDEDEYEDDDEEDDDEEDEDEE